MPLFTGMELAHAIREIDAAAKIIFLTSSPEFAVESYEVKASGYLLKPLQKEKLHSVLDDCVAPPEGEPEHVIIRTSHGYHKIYLHDIECLEAQNKKVIFHLTGGDARDALGTFSNYAEDLTMELSTRTVRRAGQEITLSSKEYAILEYLLRNKGVVLSRAQLESHVWDYDFEGGSNIVDVYVRYLRRKIDDPFEKKLIQTVRGVGYTIRQTP